MHPVTDADGRAVTVIRARRPLATTRDGRPRRRHPRARSSTSPTGIWQGAASGARRRRTDSRRPTTDAPDYHRGRPVPVRADARRARPAPVGRGPPRAALARARRALPRTHDGDDGHRVLGLGAPRAGRARRRRLQRLGRQAPRHALDGRQRRLGAVRPRARRRDDVQVRAPLTRTATGSRPTRWPATPRCRPATASVVTRVVVHAGPTAAWMTRARVDARRRAADDVYELHLGSWRPRPRLPRRRRPAHRLRDRAGLHARRVPARSPSTRSAAPGATR